MRLLDSLACAMSGDLDFLHPHRVAVRHAELVSCRIAGTARPARRAATVVAARHAPRLARRDHDLEPRALGEAAARDGVEAEAQRIGLDVRQRADLEPDRGDALGAVCAAPSLSTISSMLSASAISCMADLDPARDARVERLHREARAAVRAPSRRPPRAREPARRAHPRDGSSIRSARRSRNRVTRPSATRARCSSRPRAVCTAASPSPASQRDRLDRARPFRGCLLAELLQQRARAPPSRATIRVATAVAVAGGHDAATAAASACARARPFPRGRRSTWASARTAGSRPWPARRRQSSGRPAHVGASAPRRCDPGPASRCKQLVRASAPGSVGAALDPCLQSDARRQARAMQPAASRRCFRWRSRSRRRRVRASPRRACPARARVRASLSSRRSPSYGGDRRGERVPCPSPAASRSAGARSIPAPFPG